MFSARNAILASLALMLIAVIGGTLNLAGPPDSDGLAADSYGTHRDGHRATFELLKQFGVPVERRIGPPDAKLPINSTLVLWGPHDDLVENEPAYLERLLPWVESGGRLVVAPPARVNSVTLFRNTPMPKLKKLREFRSLWSVLELHGLEITEGPGLMEGDQSEARRPASQMPWDEILRETSGTQIQSTSIVTTAGTGNWKALGDRVKHLRVPSLGTSQIKNTGTAQPEGELLCQHVNGSSWTLAASYSRGKGEIVVIAEPLVLGNGQLAEVDNAVLTYDLLRSGDRSVIFDEFYHGLSVRGNPLWLLTRRGAALLVTVLLLGIAVGIWRQAIILGPPLAYVPRSRRVILEYIDAMAGFLTRSTGVKPFLLVEAREGVLRLLGERLNLPPGQHDRETITAALTRRSPTESQGFQEALVQLDRAIQQGHTVSAPSTIQAIQRLFRCL